MEHGARDVDLQQLVAALSEAGLADDLDSVRHLLAEDVMTDAPGGPVAGADATMALLHSWRARLGRIEVEETISGDRRIALRLDASGVQFAVFLTVDDDGRIAAITVA